MRFTGETGRACTYSTVLYIGKSLRPPLLQTFKSQPKIFVHTASVSETRGRTTQMQSKESHKVKMEIHSTVAAQTWGVNGSPRSLSFSSWTVLESLQVCVCWAPHTVFHVHSIVLMWMSVWGGGTSQDGLHNSPQSEAGELKHKSPDILSLTIRYVNVAG